MNRQSKHTRRIPPRIRQRLIIVGAAVAGLFIIVNLILWVVYRERTYPRTGVMGTAIGSVAYSSLSDTVSKQRLLPEKLTFTHDEQQVTVNLNKLGVRKDVERTVQSADEQRAWLPIVNLFDSPELSAPVSFDRDAFAAESKTLAAAFRKDAVNARLTLSGAAVGAAAAQDGYELDTGQLQNAILAELDRGEQTVAVPVKRIAPAMTVSDLQDDKKELEQRIATPVSFSYNSKQKQASREEIASWYVQSGSVYALSADALQAYIVRTGSGFGVRVKDISLAVKAVEQALADKKTTTVALTAQTALKTYAYCTAVKGVDAGQISGLRTKLKSAYADPRGWSLDGLVEYKEVTAGCDFTVWLSAAELMPTFGAICDSMWSCRVGPNVVINYDRWQNASPAWNASGGSLDEYRNMVINHETGHWLGFSHRQCSGAGQPAPVMQQQSIDLQGCSFNAWPVAAELTTLRQKLGI